VQKPDRNILKISLKPVDGPLGFLPIFLVIDLYKPIGSSNDPKDTQLVRSEKRKSVWIIGASDGFI
jgi:hypothetical protein